MPRDRDPVLQALIDRHTLRTIARAAGVTRWAVGKWSRVPAKHVPALARAFRLPRFTLRPDLWEAPPGMDAAA